MVKSLNRIAKQFTETTSFDRDSNTLFVHNPGISFEALKSLAKKHNFQIGQTKEGDFVSIPLSHKYTNTNGDEISLYDDFMATYTYYNKNYDTLVSAYKVFDLMDENLAEVGLMLDTYVGEVLSQGFINNPLKIKISNQKAQSLIEKVFYKNKIYQRLPDITRSIAKYGNYGMVLSYPCLESKIVQAKEIDITEIDILEDLNINFVNPKFFKVNVDEYSNPVNYETQLDGTFTGSNTTSVLHNKVWQPWQFVHFALADEITEPYGKSMLWAMRSAFDQLTSLEALLAISRASKIQRLVFYVPLPHGVSTVDSYNYMNEFKSNYLNSMFTDNGSTRAGRKIPGAMSILTLPKSADGRSVEVDKIESNIDLSSTEDVEYFLEKILRNSKLPKGYLIGDDVITTAQTLEAQDLKLKRGLIPLKYALVNGIMVLIENILTHAGFDVAKTEVVVSIDEPIQIPADVIAKYADIGGLLGTFMELNPEMNNVNKFQFLVKMGMPTDLASLIFANSSIAVLDNVEDLGKFLTKQKLKTTTSVDSSELEEQTAVSMSSKVFLKENTAKATQFKALYEHLRTTTDRSLKEAVLVGESISHLGTDDE